MDKRLFFTAGPSQLYHTVPSHISAAISANIPSISHRGPEFTEVLKTTQDGLRELLQIPDDSMILFFASATEIWERLIQNCVEESSFHFVNGSFGGRFYWTAEMLQRKPQKVEVPMGKGFDIASVTVPENVEMMCFTHNESSSGVMWDMKDIYALHELYPEKLVAIDVVSSIPYPNINYTKTDAVYFSVQKGFGLPAGLGVLILSSRAYAKSVAMVKKRINTGSYHSFPVMKSFDDKGQTTETPNVLNIYLLGKVVQDYLEYSIVKIRKDTDEKAEMLNRYFEKHDRYTNAVENFRDRSQTMVVITTNGDSKKIIQALDKDNIEVGYGYGEMKEKQVRIANFPAHSKLEVEYLIDSFSRL